MKESETNERRKFKFKITEDQKTVKGDEVVTSTKAIVSIPFETKATDKELESWMRDQVEHLESIRADIRTVAHAGERIEIQFVNLDTGERGRPLLLPVEADVKAESFSQAVHKWLEGVMTTTEKG